MSVAVPLEALLGPRMTLAEWAELAEDVPGELVDGRLVEEEVPDYAHEVIVAWLIHVLVVWAERTGAIVAGSEAKFALGEGRGRKPDVTVFLAGRRPPRWGVVSVPPDIAVEVISRSPRDQRRDRIEKAAEYAAFGIAWYWLVDPDARTLEILELDRGSYQPRLGAQSGAVDVPGCPGLSLKMDELWAKLERLEP
jgi:Uma2 family endonuclease